MTDLEKTEPDIIFKYSVKKLLKRKVIALFALGLFALMVINEPFWHLRSYVPESVAYILNGPPRFEHSLNPEQLARFRERRGLSGLPLGNDITEKWWAFYIEHGGTRATVLHLDIVRYTIFGILFSMATPLILTGVYADKRVNIRLTKDKLISYHPWRVLPFNEEEIIDWHKVISIEPVKTTLIDVRFLDTEGFDKKEIEKKLLLSTKYLEDERDDILQNMQRYMIRGKTLNEEIFS